MQAQNEKTKLKCTQRGKQLNKTSKPSVLKQRLKPLKALGLLQAFEESSA